MNRRQNDAVPGVPGLSEEVAKSRGDQTKEPIMAIVKEFIDVEEDKDGQVTLEMVPRIVKNLVRIIAGTHALVRHVVDGLHSTPFTSSGYSSMITRNTTT
jgi:hypothetical protein